MNVASSKKSPATCSFPRVIAALSLSAATACASAQTVIGDAAREGASVSFSFTEVPAPSKSDAASSARFTIMDGPMDGNSGGLGAPHNGQVPTSSDDPAANFLLAAGTEGGREIDVVDANAPTPVAAVSPAFVIRSADGSCQISIDTSGAPQLSEWATGPEFQLEDNAKAADPHRCGWLYALYQPPDDPLTGKPIDATLPAGKWNHIRLVVSPEKCEHWINDVKYFEYVIDSDDFQERLAKSKFSRMPLFAKSDSGYIALQGDHGQVSFRNIKVREVPSNTANARP